MADIATPLVSAGGHLLSRHQSALGIVAWVLILLVVGNIVFLVVGRFRNKRPRRRVAIRTAILVPDHPEVLMTDQAGLVLSVRGDAHGLCSRCAWPQRFRTLVCRSYRAISRVKARRTRRCFRSIASADH